MVSLHFLVSLGPPPLPGLPPPRAAPYQGSPQVALAPRRHGAPRHGAPRLGLWLRLAGLSAGWLACRLSAGFRLEFRLDFGSGLASVGFWLDLAFIHQDFGWIWLDFGLTWLDSV